MLPFLVIASCASMSKAQEDTIQAFASAVNAEDAEVIASCFAEDGMLLMVHGQAKGHQQIQALSKQSITTLHTRIEVKDIQTKDKKIHVVFTQTNTLLEASWGSKDQIPLGKFIIDFDGQKIESLLWTAAD
jgi:uncharacterized protein (TIGR02246 family)